MKMKRLSSFVFILGTLSVIGCSNRDHKKKTVLAIPVYGQSLALGEQSLRITDFNLFSRQLHHHVLTENMDEEFGYLSNTHFKQWAKKILHDRHRAFELSIYGMSEILTSYFEKKGWGDSILICTFPGGQGATSIVDLSRGSVAYEKFLDEIKTANEKAINMGYTFVLPAYCWMQGEDDVVWKKSADYKKDLKNFQLRFNEDVKRITGQKQNVKCISYQTNCLTLAKDYRNNDFGNKATYVPQAQLDLIANDPMFMTSGPTYPYTFIKNTAHIDGLSQKKIGYMQGLSVIRMMESKESKGIIPKKYVISGDTVLIDFNVPRPPLVLDTQSVVKAPFYGFSVVNTKNEDLIQRVILEKNRIKLYCLRSPAGCKVRYAVNGIKGKTGNRERSRGNLRDSQGLEFTALIGSRTFRLDNWLPQFDVFIP